MKNAMLEATAGLLDAGIALHWLAPRGKNPVSKDWSTREKDTKESLLASYREGYNIGVRTGSWSKTKWGYLHIIDLDIRKPEKAKEAWDALLEMIPTARILPSVVSGSGGESRHIYFFTSKPFGIKKLCKSEGSEKVFDKKLNRDVTKNDWEIDLCGTGKNVALPPSIHPSGKPYRWENPIDFDMPMLMTLPAEQIEELGGRTNSGQPIDEDDLEYIMAYRVEREYEDEEIEEWLEELPVDWVDDYHEFVKVGQALHHYYEGGQTGFDMWTSWAKTSDKKMTDEEYESKWESFKNRTMNPVTIGSIRKTIMEQRSIEELGLEADDDGFDEPSAPAGAVTIDLKVEDDDILGTSEFASTGRELMVLESNLDDLLGDEVTKVDPLKMDVDLGKPPSDWQTLLHRNEDGDLKSTLENVRLLLQNDLRTFGIIGYNEFKNDEVLIRKPRKAKKKREKGKEVVNLDGPMWSNIDPINGTWWSDVLTHSIRAAFEASTTRGGYGIKISDRDLNSAISIVARENSFHPVRDRLESFVWDGKPRMTNLFTRFMGSPDDAYHRECARIVLLGAVTRIYEPGHKFDFVVILEGSQGKGKSQFIRTLSLGWYNELTGDPSDTKAMVETMQGSWILEMGELSAMGRVAVNDMKAFVTRPVDKVRLSYAKRAGEYPRQCIFMGSTNDAEYLRDTTGGRRWWPVKCHTPGMIDIKGLQAILPQIWAEAVHEYKELRKAHPYGELPLYLADPDAADEALLIQDSRRSESAEELLAGQIENWLDTPIGDGFDDLDGVSGELRQETCIPQIWEKMLKKDGAVPQGEAIKIGNAFKLIEGWTRTPSRVAGFEINKTYGKCRVYTRNK